MHSQEEIRNHIVSRIASSLDDLKNSWRSPSGTTTRHVVIDNLLPVAIASSLYEAFPRDAKGFRSLDTFRERKRTSADLSNFDEILAACTYAIQSDEVVKLIAELTGIDDLEADPLLYAGGLSMMFKGDFLNPHIDNSHNASRDRYRRLNLLYYVSPDWTLENGGNFELWDARVKTPKTIVSQQNRLLIMETTKTSWHSVIQVQSEAPRCCVSSYFFSKGSPNGKDYYHVTSYMARPEQPFRRAVSVLDNASRNVAASVFGLGRGRRLVNQDKRR